MGRLFLIRKPGQGPKRGVCHERAVCVHPLGAPQVQAVASQDQGGTRLV